MTVDDCDHSSALSGSPNAGVFETNTGFNFDIESAPSAAKLERNLKPRVTHEVDGFAVIAQGGTCGQFELPSHIDPNRELQCDTPKGETKKILREWGLAPSGSSVKSGISSLYGANANVSPMGGSFQPQSTPGSFSHQGTPTVTSPSNASPKSVFSMERATSMARTFMNEAAAAKDIALQAAGIREEDTYSDSDDKFFVDENAMPFKGSFSTGPKKKGKMSSTKSGRGAIKRPKFVRR